MPAMTRDRASSLAAWVKLVKLRVTPGVLGEVRLKSELSPKKLARTWSPAAPTHPWPDGKSPKGGGNRNEAQLGSGTVAGLPSSSGLPSASASRIAVIGRQLSK